MNLFQMTLVALVKDKVSYQEALELKREIDNNITERQFRAAKEKCEELIGFIKEMPNDKGGYKNILIQNIVNTLYSIRGRYMETSEIGLGTYVNAKVEFVDPIRTVFKNGVQDVRRGDAGFVVYDENSHEHYCYVKAMPDLERKNDIKLWITETKEYEKIIYLEPRVEKGNILFVKTKLITERRDYLFRFLSYDGFIKNEGSTRNLIMKAGANYKVRAEYSRLATKVNREEGKIYRIGIMFAQALEEIAEEEYEKKKEKIF